MNNIKERSFLLSSILVIVFESIISTITTFLPNWLIHGFTSTTKLVFSLLSFTAFRDDVYNNLLNEINTDKVTENGSIYSKIHSLQRAQNMEEICSLFGYKIESHLVVTKDNYILTLHRLHPGNNGKRANGKVLYLHHGLLMCSEVWCCMANKEKNLPFVLCDLGYEVWLGNNRGNKYSAKNLNCNINDKRFWDFSIDEFALFDIPNSIEYVLEATGVEKLTYIGFSQGSTQGLAALSTTLKLNQLVDKIITISPATTPKGLHNWLISSMFKFSPNLIFLLFGKKFLLTSATFWQSIIYPPLFIKIIDLANGLLFNWKSENIEYEQKFSSYYHLYSTTSVKAICHWFQIIKSRKFQLFNNKFNSIYKLNLQSLTFPTEANIEIPILIFYGMSDSLVDIDVMLSQLPNESLQVIGIPNHEHLDLLWGKDVNRLVFFNLIRFLEDKELTRVEGIKVLKSLHEIGPEEEMGNFKTIGDDD